MVAVVELSLAAVEDSSASTDHLWGEGKLLAVEDQSVLAVVDEVLALGALALEVLEFGDGGRNGSVLDLHHVGDSVLLVADDSVDLSVSGVHQIGGIVVQVGDTLLEGLKSDKDISLVLDAVGVLVLGPDRVIFIEMVDLPVEVSAWQRVLICVRVVGGGVTWVLVVVVMVVWVEVGCWLL